MADLRKRLSLLRTTTTTQRLLLRIMASRKKVVSLSTDAILPMTDDYMQQIVRQEKTYEFRRYLISPSVKRIWFYLNAPHSHLRYVCRIDTARTRNPGDDPLPEDGAGNREFNTRHKDWDKYDFAYRILDVRELRTPIGLPLLKEKYGMKAAPRGLVYTPQDLLKDISLQDEKLTWTVEEKERPIALGKRKAEKDDDDLDSGSDSSAPRVASRRKTSEASPDAEDGHPSQAPSTSST